MNQEQKVIYMTSEKIPKLVSKMAIPTIISMLVTSFYNMADTYFVGKLDTQSTAAVGIVFSVMSIIQAFGFFFGHGSGNYISRKLGAGDFKEASAMASIGFFSAFLFGVFLGTLGLIFLEPISLMLGSTPTILPYTKRYLQIILFGAPFMMSSLVLNNQLRFQGSAAYGMVGVVSGAIFNIILDPIFIFAFEMGVSGAALATIIGQIISFFILIAGTRKGGNIKISIHNFKPNFHYYKEIFRGGIPSLCRQGLASIATIYLNSMAGNYGDAAIAGMSIVSRISMFANSTLIGFGQGFQPVCGFNYGAKKYGRVREAFWFCVKTAFVFLIVISVAGFTFAKPLVTIFRKEDLDVIEIGAKALQFQCLTFPLNSVIVICNMMMQSIGKSLKASIVASARQGFFFIPLVLILPRFLDLTGVQITQTIADILTFCVALPFALITLNELKNGEKNNERENIST